VKKTGWVEILDSPGICHPESLRFWQGEGSAFRLSVAIFSGSQQSQKTNESGEVDAKRYRGCREDRTKSRSTVTFGP
jgi:hypothetical protein